MSCDGLPASIRFDVTRPVFESATSARRHAQAERRRRTGAERIGGQRDRDEGALRVLDRDVLVQPERRRDESPQDGVDGGGAVGVTRGADGDRAAREQADRGGRVARAGRELRAAAVDGERRGGEAPALRVRLARSRRGLPGHHLRVSACRPWAAASRSPGGRASRAARNPLDVRAHELGAARPARGHGDRVAGESGSATGACQATVTGVVSVRTTVGRCAAGAQRGRGRSGERRRTQRREERKRARWTGHHEDRSGRGAAAGSVPSVL